MTTGQTIYTSNGSQYFNDTGADLTGLDWVTFGVRSCCSAHIALSAGGFKSGQMVYEIALGDDKNMVSRIR